MDYSSEEDSESTIEEVDAEMASMQVEHPEEAGDSEIRVGRSAILPIHAPGHVHEAEAGTTVDSVEVILPDTDQREKLVDHPQTYYCLATEPPLRKVELQVGDHVSRVENDEGITVCDVVDETLNTINYIITNAAVSDDGEMDPATTLVLDGRYVLAFLVKFSLTQIIRLKRIQYVEPETLECIFEL
ncbi:hypothetical protein E3Q19_01019 [Wallemia mellicola]|nr:hypothetical protein E3Q19_01019 [Wallemia mellicola]